MFRRHELEGRAFDSRSQKNDFFSIKISFKVPKLEESSCSGIQSF